MNVGTVYGLGKRSPRTGAVPHAVVVLLIWWVHGALKSKFMAGWQCLKRMFLEVNQPESVGEPDEQTMAVFEQGHEVGRWVQKRFPGGVLIEAEPEWVRES